MIPEVECENCFWTGDEEDLVGLHGVERCPVCGSDDVCDYKPEDSDDDR